MLKSFTVKQLNDVKTVLTIFQDVGDIRSVLSSIERELTRSYSVEDEIGKCEKCGKRMKRVVVDNLVINACKCSFSKVERCI